MINIINAPFVKFIQFLFLWILSFVKSEGLGLIFLSIIVNLILFPLYHFAEKIEKTEKEVQAKMKPKLEEFKSVYKGYELHLYTNNVYRLNNYHPAYSLRGLVSLLIQVPFFIGAYSYLSSYPGFQNISFLFLSDLSLPDGLLTVGSLTINLLPFVMTSINIITGYIYTKGADLGEKVTVVVIALFFLVILYDSPSSLLLYWTCNNIFSFFKTLFYYFLDNKNVDMEVA